MVSVQEGKVTAHKAGTATITVTTADGNKTATCEVTVVAKTYPVTGVTLNHTSATLTEGDELLLTATITPSNATNQNVNWSSSDSSVASVESGKVTAHKAGTATITVTTSDGNKAATCEVTVKSKGIPVTDIKLNKTSVEIKKGDRFFLIATIYPENATNKNLTWTSSNDAVASVQNGLVVAHAAGSAIIKVTTEYGDVAASCEVLVIADGAGGDNEDVEQNNGNWE